MLATNIGLCVTLSLLPETVCGSLHSHSLPPPPLSQRFTGNQIAKIHELSSTDPNYHGYQDTEVTAPLHHLSWQQLTPDP